SDSRTACAVIIPSIIDDVQHILVEASPSIKQPRLSWVPPPHFRFAQHDRRPRGAVNCARLLGCCSFGGPSYNIYLICQPLPVKQCNPVRPGCLPPGPLASALSWTAAWLLAASAVAALPAPRAAGRRATKPGAQETKQLNAPMLLASAGRHFGELSA